MIKRVFVDTDVILDVALARKPFVLASKTVLSLLENYISMGFTSANSIGNLYYILRKAGGEQKSRQFLTGLLEYITVIPVQHADALEALSSAFSDFEDALQNAAANNNQCECIVTRNTEDYIYSELPIYEPVEFLHFFR
jgi:predicted nucleic acid-binding protein